MPAVTVAGPPEGSATFAHVGGAVGTVVPLGAVVLAGVLVALGHHARARDDDRRGPATWRTGAAIAGLAAVAVAVSPPLEEATETGFTAHMVQHLLLMSLAAPLLVVGRCGRLLVRGVRTVAPTGPTRPVGPQHRRLSVALARARRDGRVAVLAGVVASLTMLVWHVPGPYEAALATEAVHALEHLALFGSALWLWAAVLSAVAASHLALIGLLVNAIAHAALGGLLTFATRPVYEPYAEAGLADQQLAGLLMWVPAGMVHLLVAGVIVATWLRTSDQRSRRQEALARHRAAATLEAGR